MFTRSPSKAILLLVALFLTVLTVVHAQRPARTSRPSPPPRIRRSRGDPPKGKEEKVAKCKTKKDAFNTKNGFLSGAEQVCCYFGPESGLCKPVDEYKDEEKSCATVGDLSEWNCCVTKEADDKFIYKCTAVKGPLHCSECPNGCTSGTEGTSSTLDENMTTETELQMHECTSSSESLSVTEKGTGEVPSPSPSPAGWISCCNNHYPDRTWCLFCV